MSELRETASDQNRRRFRWLVRGACLVLATVIFLVARQTRWPIIVPSLSPFVGFVSLPATRAFHAGVWLGLVVGLAVLVRPRWFCRWVCPLGVCADGASRLGRQLGRPRMRSTRLGQWIVWLTVGGACLGVPLLLWLDPLALLASAFRVADSPSAWMGLVPAAAVLLLSTLWPQSWCGHICPLGAFQDLLSRLVRRRSVRSDRDDGLLLARRAVLGAGVGAASGAALRLTGGSVARPLRPPGAVDESRFVGVCVRCGNCARACPTRIVKADLGGHGLRGLLTPILGFQDGYCREDCTACTRVCPSGALGRLTVEEKAKVPLGIPKVDMSVCLLGDERECSECKRWCPHGAIRYVFSEAEYTLVPQVDLGKCTGCGACEMACPVRPKKAIVVAPLSA